MGAQPFTTIKILKTSKYKLKILAAHANTSMGAFFDDLITERENLRLARERNAEGRTNFKA